MHIANRSVRVEVDKLPRSIFAADGRLQMRSAGLYDLLKKVLSKNHSVKHDRLHRRLNVGYLLSRELPSNGTPLAPRSQRKKRKKEAKEGSEREKGRQEVEERYESEKTK